MEILEGISICDLVLLTQRDRSLAFSRSFSRFTLSGKVSQGVSPAAWHKEVRQPGEVRKAWLRNQGSV